MKKYQSIFLMMFFMFSTLFTTVAYAGLSQRLAITGEAEFRVPADIRVTGISIGQTNGNVYNYTPKYSKETITMGFNLAASSSITYNVTVRNSGDIDQTIYDVSTVSTNNQGVTCSLTGYNKKDVIGYRDSVTFGVTCTSAAAAENVNIVLQFDFRKVYYVTYDANSGTNAPSAQIKYENEDLEITGDEPIKEGYAFLGWSDSSSATTAQYEPGDTYTLNSDKLLYAVWQLSSYTVTYDKTTNGGTGPNEEETITYNESIDLTKTANKTGWTFVGWNTNKNAQTALSSLTMGGQPVTLYAIYSKTLTGTFNYYNEESTTVSTTIYNAETSGTITAPGALGGDTTYTFNGWSESNSANPGNNKVGASASITISENKNYYASYTYTVTGTYYYYNGSVFTSDSVTATAYMGYNGSKTGGTPTAPTVSTPSTWTNRGWTTGTAANSDTITPGAITTDTTYYYTFSRTAVATVCVYDSSCTAKTGVTAYRSSYNNGNTYTNASINLGTTSLSGYTFLGWKKDDTTVGSTVDVSANGNASIHDNAIYYARYSNTVTITYTANGGSTPSTTASNTTTTAYMSYAGATLAGTVTMPAATSRTGYTFAGWGSSKYAAGSTQSFTSNQTLAAQFTANTYTVTFDENINLVYGLGNTSGEVTDVRLKYSINDGVVTGTALANDGYGFTTGRIDLVAGKTYIFNCDTNGVWGDVADTVEAFFMLNGQYNSYYHMATNNNMEFTPTTTGTYWLRFDVNQSGKTYKFWNISVKEKPTQTKSVTYGTTYTDLPGPTRTGYTFDGWNGKNLFNKDSVAYKTNCSLDPNAVEYCNGDEFSIYQTNIKSNTTYTITNSGRSSNPGYALYDSNNSFIVHESYNGRTKVTFTTPSNASYIRFTVVTNSSSYRYDENIFQLEEGSTATTYEPYYVTSDTTVTTASNHTLTAQWTKNKYAVTYDVTTNGGSGSNSTVSYDYASTINPSDEKSASKTGWTFVGWNTDKNATAGLSSYQIPASTTVLYAIYKKELTGTFRYYNNQSTTSKTTIYNTATSGTITAPAKAGEANDYTFRHWSTSNAANASSTVAAGGSITISANTDYYASYQKTVTGTFYYSNLTADSFDMNVSAVSTTATATQYRGYTGTVVNTNFTVPTAVSSSKGGATAENYQGVATSENSATVATPTTANTAFYAVYTESLTFYYYNGSSHTSKQVTRRMLCSSGKYSNSLSESAPTPSNYDSGTYDHWSYDSAQYSSSYLRRPLETGVNSLYAVYTRSITGTFNYHDGSKAASTTASSTRYYVSKSGGVNTYNTNISVPSAVSTNRTISSVVYTYRGVSTSNAANATVATPTTANTTYYASYSYTPVATFVYYNGSAYTSSTANGGAFMKYDGTKLAGTAPTTPAVGSSSTVRTPSGWTNRGWSTGTAGDSGTTTPGAITANTTYYYTYSKSVKATVCVHNNSCSDKTAANAYLTSYNSGTVKNASIGLGTTSLSGYTFRGWSTSNAANATISVAANGNASINANTTYYASYTYTVTGTFVYYNGSAYTSTANTASAFMGYTGSKTGAAPTTPSVGTPSGWTNRGWSTGTAGDSGTTTPGAITANTTYYYTYSKSVKATVCVHNNSCSDKTAANAYLTSYNSGTVKNASIGLGTTSLSGYTFRGWSTSNAANATISVSANGSASISANTTYYASYYDSPTATFYYWDGSAQKSATASATRYMNYKGSYAHSNYSVPSAVSTNRAKDSITYTYRGVSTNSGASASVATPTTANTTYYASYSKAITATFYYWDGSAQKSATADATRYMNSAGTYGHSNYSVPSAVSTNRAKDSITYTYRGVSTNSGASASVVTPTTANTKFYASYSASITATFYYFDGSKQASTTASATRYMNSSGEYTQSDYSVPSAVSTNRTKDGVTYAYRGVSTTTEGNATVATPRTYEVKFYASYSASITATFYYYSGSAQTSTTASATRYMNSSGTYTHSNYSVPSAVSTARTKDSISYSYRGVSTSNAANASVATPTTANTTFYASYSASITITFYYYNGSAQASTTSSGTRYMNSSGSYVNSNLSAIPSDVTQNRKKDNITYSCRGISTSSAANASVTTASTANTTYYSSYSASITATFYYSKAAAGTKASTTASATRYMNSSGSYIHSNYSVPTLTGDTAPTGTATLGWQSGPSTIGSITPTTASTTWYKTYKNAIKINYKNTSNTATSSSTALYRNAYYGTATNYTTVTSTSVDGTSQSTGSPSLSSLRGSFLGLTTSSTGTSYYGINNSSNVVKSSLTEYWAASYYKGSFLLGNNIYSIGSTSQTCNLYYSNTTGTCTVSPPTITVKANYVATGWSRSEGNSSSTSSVSPSSVSGTTYSFTANSITLYGHTSYASTAVAAKASNNVNNVTTYYTTLQAALNASTGGTTTLLADTSENITVANNANKTLNLNGKTITGSFANNGTITINGSGTIKNSGRVITNNGTMTINNATVSCTGNEFALVSNTSSSTVVKGSTLSNANTGTTSTIGQIGSGQLEFYTSTITGYGIWNSGSGNIYIYKSTANIQHIGNKIYQVSQLNTNTFEWAVWGTAITQCPTWTSNNGQDDLVWHQAASYTSSTTGTYKYCQIPKSEHKNETGAYVTHFYNGNTYVEGFAWSWQ